MANIITQWNAYQNQDWFKLANAYCTNRFGAIESRMYGVFRYIELHQDNGNTFSYELASILRDCGSVFNSTMDAIVKGSGFITKSESSFRDYKQFFLSHDPNIYTYSLQIRSLFPNGAIAPFKGMEIAPYVPKWWDAYNRIKHNEHEEFKSGNLDNCINALSSLALILNFARCFTSDPLFVNVGMPFIQGELLFP